MEPWNTVSGLVGCIGRHDLVGAGAGPGRGIAEEHDAQGTAAAHDQGGTRGLGRIIERDAEHRLAGERRRVRAGHLADEDGGAGLVLGVVAAGGEEQGCREGGAERVAEHLFLAG